METMHPLLSLIISIVVLVIAPIISLVITRRRTQRNAKKRESVLQAIKRLESSPSFVDLLGRKGVYEGGKSS